MNRKFSFIPPNSWWLGPACFILSLIFSIVAAETILKFTAPGRITFEPPQSVRFRESDRSFRRSVYDKNVLELIPNSQVEARGIIHPVNNQGFRGPEVLPQKSQDEFRILMLGDSVTFGLFIKNEADTFSRIIEKQLNEHSTGPKFTVINSGVPGFQAQQYLSFLKNRGLELKPDLVIVNYTPYDCTPMEYPDKSEKGLFQNVFQDGTFYPDYFSLPTPISAWLFRHSLLYRSINFTLMDIQFSSGNRARKFFFSEEPLCFERFQEATKLLREKGIKVAILGHPFFVGRTWTDDALRLRTAGERILIKSFAERLQIPFRDLFADFEQKFSTPKDAAYDDIHPKEAAQPMIAARALEMMRTEALLPQQSTQAKSP